MNILRASLIFCFLFIHVLKSDAQTSSHLSLFWQNVEQGRWNEMEHYFNSPQEHATFLSYFCKKDENGTKKFYPFKIKSIDGKTATLYNIVLHETFSVQLELDTTQTTAKIIQYDHSIFLSSQKRLEAVPYNYAALPSNVNEKVSYLDTYLDEFNKSGISEKLSEQDALFRQVDFQPSSVACGSQAILSVLCAADRGKGI